MKSRTVWFDIFVTLSINDVNLLKKKSARTSYAIFLHTLKTKYIRIMFTDTDKCHVLSTPQTLSTDYYSTFCVLTFEPQHLL